MDVTHKQKQVTGILPKMFLILLGTALITLSSYITVPMYPAPVTAQTLVVLLIGLS